MKKSSPLESWEQKELVRWLVARRIAFFSVPNEGKRSPRLANHMKAMGLVHGVPDMVLITLPPMAYEGPGIGPVAIEMKRSDGKASNLTDYQRAMHETMRIEGWNVLVCFGHRHAIEQLEELGYGL